MITSFNPGPSLVYPEIKQYLQDAYEEGLLSISHRSEQFNRMSEQTLSLLRQKLAVPDGFEILYTSSATECWEIIAQSFTKRQSVHLYSGAFGEKWFQYAQALHPNSIGYAMPLNEGLYAESMAVRAEDEVICLTQNETSNGTQIDFETLASIRGAFPQKLIALDCTSSLAGINLPFNLGDIWFGSVQKCFGLPAGLGVLILSPKAIAKAQEMGEKSHYNSALTMLEHIKKYQTSCTPNVLGIYLLNRVMTQVEPIERIDQRLRKRMDQYQSLFNGPYSLLITNSHIRSVTTLAVESSPEKIDQIKAAAKAENIQLGSGYGAWKANTFRIANFPAHSEAQVNKLVDFLQRTV